MAEIENVNLKNISTCKNEANVEFIADKNHQVIIKLPTSSISSNENLNNSLIRESQSTNGSSTTNGNANIGLSQKIQNNVVVPVGKRPVASLSHLPKRPPVNIAFEDLTYTVNEGNKRGPKTILKSVNGKFKSGELTAIMGPSGAGKSTLMNVLAGYKTSNFNGSILINGKERSLRRFRKMSCYIMQDDRLLPHLTVHEAMTAAANLKIGNTIDLIAKKDVVREIIDTLGLNEASNTQTHCLSGGQRKRLSIALELVNNPPVMFFDEPTSGLDSSSCFQCLNLLKTLSRGGRTIVCTIHQPSARLFEMFDNLYLLAEGQCIYHGNVGGLVPFLSSMNLHCPSYHNPADYVMEVACGEHGECLDKLVVAVKDNKCFNYQNYQITIAAQSASTNDIKKTLTLKELNNDEHLSNGILKKSNDTVINVPISCTTSLINSTNNAEKMVGFPTNGWLQFWILLKRTFISEMRDMTLTRVRLISHVTVGLLIGGLYYDIGNEGSEVYSNAGSIFFTIMFLMFTAMMPTILTFPNEMAVFVREHLNYWYSLKSFYLAKTFADLPFQILFSLLYVVIVYVMTSQPFEAYRFFLYLNICVLTSLVSQSIGLLIGAAMNVENGMFIGPVTSVPLVLFSGFFIKFTAMPNCLRWLSYVSYVRYGFEGAMISIFGYKRPRLACNADYCHFRTPMRFLEEMAMENAVYWKDALALVAFLIVLRISTYFVLRLKLRSLR